MGSDFLEWCIFVLGVVLGFALCLAVTGYLEVKDRESYCNYIGFEEYLNIDGVSYCKTKNELSPIEWLNGE